MTLALLKPSNGITSEWKKMKKEQFIKKIIRVEIIGFFIILLISWLDELLDLPHIFFGASPSPINYFESIFESALLSVIAIL